MSTVLFKDWWVFTLVEEAIRKAAAPQFRGPTPPRANDGKRRTLNRRNKTVGVPYRKPVDATQ